MFQIPNDCEPDTCKGGHPCCVCSFELKQQWRDVAAYLSELRQTPLYRQHEMGEGENPCSVCVLHVGVKSLQDNREMIIA